MAPSPISTPAAKGSNVIFVTSRESVLQSLKEGETLSVKVLETIDAEKVLLQIKGAPVTAKNLGDAKAGQTLRVQVRSTGSTFVLQRVGTEDPDAVRINPLKALVRFGITKGLFSADALTALADGDPKSLLPQILTRPLSLAQSLFPELPDSAGLRDLLAMFGLRPDLLTDRAKVESGKNSLYAALRKLMDTPAGKLLKLLRESGADNLDQAKQLLEKAGTLRRAIEAFRAANLLADKEGRPAFLPVPYGPPGQRRMAQVYWYAKSSDQDVAAGKDDFTIYIRLELSALGDVRVVVQKQGEDRPVSLRFFAEKHALDVIRENTVGLKNGLDKIGIEHTVSVLPLGNLEDPNLSFDQTLAEIAGVKTGLSVRA